jgi:hypothetical protein
MVITVVNLEGRWRGEGDESSRRAVISVSPQSITINMSAFGRPAAHGSILGNSTIRVNFPDDNTFTGKLERPITIRWSNGTVWKKVIDIASVLGGYWTAVGPQRAVISVSSQSITINMSAFGRPAAHGSIINDSTFTVNFPDDRTYAGTLEGPETIRWSNDTVCTKMFIEG